MVTAELLDGLRGRLRAFCYQMLGSPFDAEDAVQDVLERAWRSRARYDPSRSSLSTWCLAIARNVCIDRIRQTGRRSLPRDLQSAGIDIDAPLVAAPDLPWLMPAPDGWLRDSAVEQIAQTRADIRFAVTVLLQSLPAMQRAAFTLRELLGLSAADAAAVLDASVPAVNSALQRARAAMSTGGRADRAVAREKVERYAAALERGDVGTLVSLVAADVVLEMPPVPAWSRGLTQYRDFMTRLFAVRGNSWATRVIRAGGGAALLLSTVDGNGRLAPHTLQLFGADDRGAIDHVLVYRDDRLFRMFDA